MKKQTLRIETGVSERDFIEGCLNLYNSGYEFELIFGLYALVKKWNIDKFAYYYNLIVESKNENPNKR